MSLGFRILKRRRAVNAALVQQARSLPVANISDCVNRLFAGGPTLRPYYDGPTMAGAAFTVNSDVTVLGTKKTLPFELLGSRAVVGRLAINLEERMEQVWDDGMIPVQPPREIRVQIGSTGTAANDRIVKSRAGVIRACYQRELNRNPGLRGTLRLRIQTAPDGTVVNAGMLGDTMGAVGDCVAAQARRMRFPENQAGDTFLVPLMFSASN